MSALGCVTVLIGPLQSPDSNNIIDRETQVYAYVYKSTQTTVQELKWVLSNPMIYPTNCRLAFLQDFQFFIRQTILHHQDLVLKVRYQYTTKRMYTIFFKTWIVRWMTYFTSFDASIISPKWLWVIIGEGYSCINCAITCRYFTISKSQLCIVSGINGNHDT